MAAILSRPQCVLLSYMVNTVVAMPGDALAIIMSEFDQNIPVAVPSGLMWPVDTGDNREKQNWRFDKINIPESVHCTSWKWLDIALFVKVRHWNKRSLSKKHVRSSVCDTFFHNVPLIVSSWNQELLPLAKVMSMQKVKVRGQRPQRSKHIFQGHPSIFKVLRAEKWTIWLRFGRLWIATPIGIHGGIWNDMHGF